jgi:hypothetical protein
VGKLIKWLAVLAFVGGLLYGASYLGARTTAGKMVRDAGDMGTRTIRFAWDGLRGVQGNPRGWEFSYSRAQAAGGRPVKIFISPTGKLLATSPPNLDQLLETAARAREDR